MDWHRSEQISLIRRKFIQGGLVTGGFILLGCSPSGNETAATAASPQGRSPRPSPAAAMTVHRDPSCGCCRKWAELATTAGYQVALVDEPDMAALKRRLGVPEALASCHTVEIAGLVLEGHVPFQHVQRLLSERPAGIRGLAVPGMPVGSPGMEAPDGTQEPFQVIAFDAAGRTSVFVA